MGFKDFMSDAIFYAIIGMAVGLGIGLGAAKAFGWL